MAAAGCSSSSRPGRIRVVQDGALRRQPVPRHQRADRLGRRARPARARLRARLPDRPALLRRLHRRRRRHGHLVVHGSRARTPDRADPDSERVLLQIDQPFANHNGGVLAFGPDGDLYVGMGDGGSGGDPLGNGQSLDDAPRQDPPDRPGGLDAGDPAYTIPPDNPFATDTAARPEIFAYGLRNPWRLSFDRATGDLWIGDVGQGAWEEVDHWPAGPAWTSGPNFGWNVMEGRHCYSAAGLRPDRARRAGRRVRPRPGLRDRRGLRRAEPGRAGALRWLRLRRRLLGQPVGPRRGEPERRSAASGSTAPGTRSRRSARTRPAGCTSPTCRPASSCGSSRSPDRPVPDAETGAGLLAPAPASNPRGMGYGMR